MVEVLPKKDIHPDVLHIDFENSTPLKCQVEVTIRGDSLPYHDPVTAHCSYLVGNLLFTVLDFFGSTGRWPTSEDDIACPYLDQCKEICGGYLRFQPKRSSCAVEFITDVDGRHYAYILRVKDSDKPEDYLFGGKLSPITTSIFTPKLRVS